jgi:hypothetical protein
MPYASTALISFVGTFTATSTPNATQVHSHLRTTAAQLDGALSRSNYTIPVPTTATYASDLLRTWNAVGAAWKTTVSMPQGIDSKHEALLRGEWEAILHSIGSGDINLVDAEQDSTAAIRYAAPAANESATPFFSRADVDYHQDM